MSRKPIPHPHTVIEWSTKGVAVLDPNSRTVRRFEAAQQAANLIGGQAVVAAVSRRVMFVRTMRVPNASPAEVDLIVRMKLGELFPLPPGDLAYSVELTQDLSSEGRLAVVVAMSAIELRKLHEELKAAGFRVHSVVPLSYGSVLLAQSLNLQSCAVASRDESGIGIDIVQEGVLRYSRVAPMAANAAAEVCRTYTVAGIPCGDIVAAEGLLIDEADVVSAISPLEALSGAWPSFVPTLELPEVVALKVTKQRSANMRLAVMMFLGGVLLAGYAYLDYSDQQTKARQVKEDIENSVKELSTTGEFVKKDAGEAVAIESSLKRGFEPAQKLSDVISVATNSAPPDVWLNGVTLERGKQLLIRGTSRTSEAIAAYLTALTNAAAPTTDATGGVAARFRNVQMVTANAGKIDEVAVVQFSISAFPVGNIPLFEPPKKGAKK